MDQEPTVKGCVQRENNNKERVYSLQLRDRYKEIWRFRERVKLLT